ncbi:MAG: 2-dehydropantoate 2-reductase [Blautia sp.]|nr:2-dehydropantoate 2-reductase [Blautia sp.]
MSIQIEEIRNPKIAIVGLGGVGGYLGGMLGKAYDSVSMVARRERYDAIKKNGLVLHSEKNGEITAQPAKLVHSAAELEIQDFIFLSVKNYSLEDALTELAPAVDEHTVIVPVMNGVDPGDRVRKGLGKGIVVDALIYIVSFARPDYSIEQQGDFADLYVGLKESDETKKQALDELDGILTHAGINHKISADIEADIWKKYILNCAYNVATAYYDNTIGELRKDPVKTKEYADLATEAYKVAIAKGVRLEEKHLNSIIQRFWKYEENAGSSLQRDIHAGRPAEVETFSGYLVKEAAGLGIPVPVSEKMYLGLLEHTR